MRLNDITDMFVYTLTEIRYLVKEFRPFFKNLFVTSFNNSENVLQNMWVDTRIIMSQETFSGFRNPNFSRILQKACLLTHGHESALTDCSR